jgi:glycerol-3-phosphate dehydrogenase (NAD(P)+)
MPRMDKVSVIGAGRWGGFLAWYCAKFADVGQVMLYGRADSPSFARLEKTRRNDYLEIPARVALSSDLDAALASDLIIVAVGMQSLRGLLRKVAKCDVAGKTFLLAIKGLEQDTGKTVSQIVGEELKPPVAMAILAGPGHVEDYVAGVPSCAVVDGENPQVVEKVVGVLQSPLIRFYYGGDFIGNQVGAALKNVVGIAAGILDGLGWQGLKGALMVRAPREVARAIQYYGGDPRSVYGLAHLGDYEATLFSAHSHNRAFGEAVARKEPPSSGLAEGYFTLKAVKRLADEKGLDMPITQALYECVYKGADAKETIFSLFGRGLKGEFS